MDEGVHTVAFAVRANHATVVLVQGFNGRDDLFVRNVFVHAHLRTQVQDVHHHGDGVHFQVSALLGLFGLQTTQGFLHGGKRTGVFRRVDQKGVHGVAGSTLVHVRLGKCPEEGEEQKGEGGEMAHDEWVF